MHIVVVLLCKLFVAVIMNKILDINFNQGFNFNILTYILFKKKKPLNFIFIVHTFAFDVNLVVVDVFYSLTFISF